MQDKWSSVLKFAIAWSKASGWRRASKCKRLIQQLLLHITTQKNRREIMIRQSRGDIAQLLQNGLSLQACLTRVKQLYKDQRLLVAYDQIYQFGECIITNVPNISQQCSWQCLPIDVSEAISNLIFAASRCGELSELNVLRNLFRNRYGSEFETTNVELLPGNLVDSQMKQNLCVNSVPKEARLSLINAIANEYKIHLGLQDFGRGYGPLWQEKPEVLDMDIQDMCSDSNDGSTPASKFRPPTKMESHYNHSGHDVKIMRNVLIRKIREASPTSSSSYGIQETSFIYLDDLEAKSSSRGQDSSNKTPRSVDSCNSIAASSGSTISNVTKKKPVPPVAQLHRFSMGAPSSNIPDKVPYKYRRSLDSSSDEWKAQNGSSSSSIHVHPKLPNYEDVVAKFTVSKADYKHCKSFYY